MNLETLLQEQFANSTIFSKYPELVNKKDRAAISRFSFEEGGYSDQTIVSETMRSVIVSAVLQNQFLYPIQAPKEQLAVIKDQFGVELYPDQIIEFDNDNPKMYTQIINELPDKSVHVLHPYDTLRDEVYAVHPEIIYSLNDKSNLSHISDHTPSREVVSRKVATSKDHPLQQQVPYVLKTVTGASGDGLCIVRDHAQDLESFLKGHSQVIIEEFIDSKANYGVQFFVDKQQQAHFIGASQQLVSSQGEFIGSAYDFKAQTPPKAIEVGKQAAQSAGKKGYWGVLGFDVLEDKQDSFKLIDPNIRLTAATPPLLVRDTLQAELGRYVVLQQETIHASSATKAIKSIHDSGGLLFALSHQKNSSYSAFIARKATHKSVYGHEAV